MQSKKYPPLNYRLFDLLKKPFHLRTEQVFNTNLEPIKATSDPDSI